MDSVRTPLTASSQFIQAGANISLETPGTCWYCAVDDDDDDLDEESIPGFSHPGLSQSPVADKGKSRATFISDQLAPATSSNGRPQPSPGVSGNIGSSLQGTRTTNRQMLGGVQIETRSVKSPRSGYTLKRMCAVIREVIPSMNLWLRRLYVLFCARKCLCALITANKARDLVSIYTKLVQVLYPRRSSGREVLRLAPIPIIYNCLLLSMRRDWDLWGPLLLCLLLGIMLSINVSFECKRETHIKLLTTLRLHRHRLWVSSPV